MIDRQKYKYSITIHTDDLAVVYCLRSLANYSQLKFNRTIAWANTKDEDWQRANHYVTFRFTSPEFRKGFLSETKRLLPDSLWRESSQSDNDPARPAK